MLSVDPKTCFTHPKSLIKLIFLLICICFTISQLTECFHKLLHPPISTYYKFKLNESIKYPALTLCRKPPYKNEQFKDFGVPSGADLTKNNAFKDFDFSHYTIEEFFDAVMYDYDEVFLQYAFNGQIILPGQSKYAKTNVSSTAQPTATISKRHIFPYGLCYTILPLMQPETFVTSSGYMLRLTHEFSNTMEDDYGRLQSGFMLFLHNEKEVIVGNEEQPDSFTEYIYLEPEKTVTAILRLQTINQISTSDNPCESDPDYSRSKCIETCFHQRIVDHVGCTMPFLTAQHINNCSDHDTVKEVMSILYLRSGHTVGSKLLSKCKCQKACDIYMYSAQINNLKNRPSGASTDVFVHFPSNLVTQMEETMGYDWTVFLADIGGSLGFLLGLSVIGVIEIMDVCIQMILQVFKRRKDKEDGDTDSNKTVTDVTDLDSASIKWKY